MSNVETVMPHELVTEESTFKIPNIPAKNDSVENNVVNGEPARPENVPYTPPEWQVTPPSDSGFYVEVIKNGIIIKVIQLHDLKNETFLSVGRFPPCEIQLDHPSVSRYHCILQYGKMAGKDSWFIYDLDSTHGTRLNKQPVKKRSYTKLRPGYVFQFAGSTRIFSFCGKNESEEEPSKQSSESASALGNNNFAEDEELSAAEDGSKYYEKDPLGWLDKYFEREGIPMNFQYAKAEKAASEWSCSIELPDMPENEALVGATGLTRKLAQFQCALLACQRLAAAGVLKTSSIWNKRATYAENDYYDSDEDTFLDRTGQIETQRIKRRKRCEGGNQKSDTSASLTYNELVNSLAETEEKLKNVNSEIQRLLGKNCYTDAEGNVISTSTNFSSNVEFVQRSHTKIFAKKLLRDIRKEKQSHKTGRWERLGFLLYYRKHIIQLQARMTLSQMRSKEKRLGEECEQLKKLVTLTKPRGLNDIFPIANPRATNTAVIEISSGDSVSKPAAEVEETIELASSFKHVIEDSEASTSCEIDAARERDMGQSGEYMPTAGKEDPLKSSHSDKIVRTEEPPKRQERVFQPAGPPQPQENVIMPKFGLITKEEARIKAPVIAKKRHRQTLSDELEEKADYSDSKYSREEYATWLPPQDQIGDGKSKLNKKFEGRY